MNDFTTKQLLFIQINIKQFTHFPGIKFTFLSLSVEKPEDYIIFSRSFLILSKPRLAVVRLYLVIYWVWKDLYKLHCPTFLRLYC